MQPPETSPGTTRPLCLQSTRTSPRARRGVEVTEDVELKKAGQGDDSHVGEEADAPEGLGQAPFVYRHRHQEKDDSGEKSDGRVEKSGAVDFQVLSAVDDGGVDQPGQAQTQEDVEDVASDGVGHRHVAETCHRREQTHRHTHTHTHTRTHRHTHAHTHTHTHTHTQIDRETQRQRQTDTYRERLRDRDKHIAGSTERYLLGQKHNLQTFGVIPLIKLQNVT